MRPRLRARYGERLEGLYEEIERRQLEELEALARQVDKGTVAERVRKAITVTLGLGDLDPAATTQSFLQLGGDSLSALRLADLIRDLCGVAVPVGSLLDPTIPLGALVRQVEERLSGRLPAHRITFEQVHGKGAEVIRAEDLRLDRLLSAEDFEAAARARPRTEVPRSRGLGRSPIETRLVSSARSGRVAAQKSAQTFGGRN